MDTFKLIGIILAILIIIEIVIIWCIDLSTLDFTGDYDFIIDETDKEFMI